MKRIFLLALLGGILAGRSFAGSPMTTLKCADGSNPPCNYNNPVVAIDAVAAEAISYQQSAPLGTCTYCGCDYSKGFVKGDNGGCYCDDERGYALQGTECVLTARIVDIERGPSWAIDRSIYIDYVKIGDEVVCNTLRSCNEKDLTQIIVTNCWGAEATLRFVGGEEQAITLDSESGDTVTTWQGEYATIVLTDEDIDGACTLSIDK